jgi:hypothetical protein
MECVPSLAHRLEAGGDVVGMLQRDDPLDPMRDGHGIAAQDILSQSGFQKGDAAAEGERPALGLCALPFGEALVGLPCRAVDISGPGLCGYAGENSIDEIAKIAAACALFHVLNGGLYGSSHFHDRLIEIEHLVGLQPPCQFEDRPPFDAGSGCACGLPACIQSG